MLGITFSMPQSYAATRWLSCFDAAANTLKMFPALQLFFYSFLNSTDQRIYKEVIKNILSEHKVSFEVRKRIKHIMESLGEKKLTTDGQKRKERILKNLMFTPSDTRMLLQF